MNATPTPASASTAVLQSAPGRAPEAASADTPFSQVLSNEIAQQQVTDRAAPASQTDVAALLDSLREAPDEALVEIDPAAVQALPAEAQPQAVSAEALLGLCLPQQPLMPQQPLARQPALQASGQAEAALDLDTPRQTPINARLGMQGGTESPGSAAAPLEEAPSADAFALRPLSEAGRSADAPAGLINPAALRAAPAPSAADTGPAVTPATSRLAPEVGSSAWGQALGDKVVWMASGSQQSASLTLNPPNLGPLQIVLNVSNDQATANFFAAQPEVRQAIEDALPRLREMMSEAGIQLGQASVSADTPSQNQPSEQPGRGSSTSALAPDDAEQDATMAAPRTGRGLVDTFA